MRRSGPWLVLLGVPLAVVGLSAAVVGSSLSESEPTALRPIAGPRPVPEPPDLPLRGLVVYVSAGHGWLLHRVHHDGEPIHWGQQRAPSFGMVEDDWTAAFTADDLAPALEAEGATVIALRERDRNPEAWIVEDGDPTYSAFGLEGRRADPVAGSGHAQRLMPGGAADWTLEVPRDGHYYVYARWLEEADQDPRAVYTVRVGDVVREVVVDQTSHGGHWWPLLDACVPAGTPVDVTLTGSGEHPLSADAIRVGGGTFRVLLPWSYQIREQPYANVAMAHQLERLGGPEWLGAYECDNPVSDMRLRPHWATWASPPGENAVYLSVHTNASPWGVARGLTVFYGVDRAPVAPPDPESMRLAGLLEASVFEAVAERDPEYRNRGTRPGDYSEISPVHNGLPAALLEMGFHDDPLDAKRLQSVRFRRAAARGLVDGLIAWRAGAPTPAAVLEQSQSSPADVESGPWLRYE